MPKEIVLYSGLQNWTAESLINALNEAEGEEVVIRINSPGGDVWASWGVFAKIAEHGNVTVKVDGIAASGAFNLLWFAKEVQCLDVSTFMGHRAESYSSDDESKKLQDKQNANIRSKMEAKIDADLWKTVSGVSYDDFFASDKRVNVWLDAKQMKKLGVVTKINKLTPTEAKAIAAATTDEILRIAASLDEPIKPTPEKSKSMTPEEFKAKHPEAYAAIVKVGAEAERDRAGAWLAYHEIDAKKSIEGAAGDKPMTAKVQAEFQVAALTANRMSDITTDSAQTGSVQTGEVTEAQKQKAKEISAHLASVDAVLGRKKAVA